MTRADLLELSRHAPVDGTEVFWWRLLLHGGDIHEMRAVYHVNTPWKDHPWAGGGRGVGADFVDDWAIEQRYRGGELRAEGRAVGWSDLLARLALDDTVYLSASDAEAELRARIRARLKRMREEYLELEDHLALLEVTTWPRALVLDKFPLVYHGDPIPEGDPL